MKVAASGGHAILINGLSTSADGIHNELLKDRIIKDSIIKYLRVDGNEVYDCTTPDCTVKNQNEDLKYKVKQVNNANVDLAIDVHLNCSDDSAAHGVEVLIQRMGNSSQDYAVRVNNNLVSLGFRNRGVKEDSGLAFLRNTNCKAILVECYFCSNQNDCNLADSVGFDEIGKKIAEGIVGHEIIIEEPTIQIKEVEGFNLKFNEQYYLQTYADIRQEKEKNPSFDCEWHYNNYGKAEGRRGFPELPMNFSEGVYLKNRPDVITAINKGEFTCGAEHYLIYGWNEGTKYSID